MIVNVYNLSEKAGFQIHFFQEPDKRTQKHAFTSRSYFYLLPKTLLKTCYANEKLNLRRIFCTINIIKLL